MIPLFRHKMISGVAICGLVFLSACKEGGQYEGTWGFEVNGDVVQEMDIDVASKNGKTFMRFTRDTPYGDPMVEIVEVRFEDGEAVPANGLSDTPEILDNGNMRYEAEIWTPQ